MPLSNNGTAMERVKSLFLSNLSWLKSVSFLITYMACNYKLWYRKVYYLCSSYWCSGSSKENIVLLNLILYKYIIIIKSDQVLLNLIPGKLFWTNLLSSKIKWRFWIFCLFRRGCSMYRFLWAVSLCGCIHHLGLFYDY